MDGSIAVQSLPEEITLEMHNELQILFLDSSGKFCVYDNTRCFLTTSFKFPDDRDIVDFAGSKNKVGEFAVLKSSNLLICQVEYDKYTELISIPLEAFQVSFFADSYLLRKRDSLIYYNNGEFKDYYTLNSNSIKAISHFHINRDHVISASADGDLCLMTIVGLTSIGLRHWRGAFWDAIDGWIVVLIKNSVLVFISDENPEQRLIVNLKNPLDRIIGVYAGYSRYAEEINVSIIQKNSIIVVNVSPSILDGTVKVNNDGLHNATANKPMKPRKGK